MGYWWLLSSWFVHVQIIIILVSLSPFAWPRFWTRILGHRFIEFMHDSLRELQKYTAREYDLYGDPITRKDARIALLKAQRNYFISGAAVVLCLVVPRLVKILRENGELSLRNDATKSAFRSFRRLIDAMDADGEIREREFEFSGPDRSGRTHNPTTIRRALVSAMQKELERLAIEGVSVSSSGDEGRRLQLERDELHQIIREYEQMRAGERWRPSAPPTTRLYSTLQSGGLNNNLHFEYNQNQRQHTPRPNQPFSLFKTF